MRGIEKYCPKIFIRIEIFQFFKMVHTIIFMKKALIVFILINHLSSGFSDILNFVELTIPVFYRLGDISNIIVIIDPVTYSYAYITLRLIKYFIVFLIYNSFSPYCFRVCYTFITIKPLF